MSHRIFAIALLCFSLWYGLMAWQIEVPFAYDPLGPKPVPLALAGLLGCLALLISVSRIKQQEEEGQQPGRKKILTLLLILFFYQATWLSLGFLLSTTISIYLFTRLFNSSWMEGLMTALTLTVCCYGLFNFVLGIKLPLGTIFSYSGG